MARVSRKKPNLPTPAVDTPIRRWKTALYETASRMTNSESIFMMQLNVYLFMTPKQSKLSGSSTKQKSTPMKTSELQSDSDVLFRGKTVEFAPKIT